MNKIGVRGLDPELFRKAKIQAAIEGRPLYQFINEAIREKLERSKKKA